MRTSRNLFKQLISEQHLERAALFTAKRKRRRPDVAWFLFRLDSQIANLSMDLSSGCYQPSPVELITIRDPKPRVISRIPIADRVVQTALVLLMEPICCRNLLPEAFACRPGFGGHRAVIRLAELMRANSYAAHLDVRAYFPSVDLEILTGLLHRSIRDHRFLSVVEQILENGRGTYDPEAVRRAAHLDKDWPPPGRGLPIGSSLSQLLAAQVYLNEFDHFVKRELKVPGYVRYVDDLFLFGAKREHLRGWRGEVEGWLGVRRNLRLKRPNARILSCRGTLDGLGYRITRDGWTARRRVYKSLQRRIAAQLSTLPGRKPAVDLERCLASLGGVLMF